MPTMKAHSSTKVQRITVEMLMVFHSDLPFHMLNHRQARLLVRLRSKLDYSIMLICANENAENNNLMLHCKPG